MAHSHSKRSPDCALVQSEMTLKYHNDESTLALKPIGRVIQIPKQRIPAAPQNDDKSCQNIKKKDSQLEIDRFSHERLLPSNQP